MNFEYSFESQVSFPERSALQYLRWYLGTVLINSQSRSPSENFGHKGSFLKDGLEQI